MAKNLLVCANSLTALKKINESEENGKGGYFLEGVFAELDTLNRNKRIYPKEEYLKHLSYLRDDIKKGEPLLGELDHPEDRFEVKLKEASHRIVDLWYDASTNCVMGKIELLNTPNGKLAQSLVEQGIPLHISSRAAGSVGSDSKVSIQQIYTYDLVCKPGFAGAVLHRVNESEGSNKYSAGANEFLKESNRSESMNAAPQYGINENEMSIREVSYDATLRKEAKEAIEEIKENENKEDMKDNKTSEEQVDEKKKLDLPKPKLKSVFEGGEDSEDNDEDKEDSEDSDEDSGVEILSVKAITDEDEDEGDVEIKDVKSEDGEDNEESEDNEKSEDNESEKTDECGDACSKSDECKGTESKDCDGKKCDPKKDALFDCNDVKTRRENFEDKFAEFVDSHKRKEKNRKANESLTIQKHPTFSMLSKENMTKVLKLDESQKSKVAAYLNDNNLCTPELINENWENGVNYVKKEEEVWLKYAPTTYRSLYEKAPASVKNSIKNTASYLLFENQYDVNNFWENTGLMESEQRRIAAEKFINTMPKLNEGKNDDDNNGLPYSKEFIQMVTEMACEFND